MKVSLCLKHVKKHPHLVALGLFVGFSLLLLVPHLLTKGMVTGADLIFHYNRFYDAAMQMKEGISPILSVCMAISSQDGLLMLSTGLILPIYKER